MLAGSRVSRQFTGPRGSRVTAGGGHQTSTSGRWGDYSALAIDPADNLTFWHTHEYYSATSNAAWNTRIGSFKFPGAPAVTSAVSRKTHGGEEPSTLTCQARATLALNAAPAPLPECIRLSLTSPVMSA